MFFKKQSPNKLNVRVSKVILGLAPYWFIFFIHFF